MGQFGAGIIGQFGVDIGQFVAEMGPFGAGIIGQFGADVIGQFGLM